MSESTHTPGPWRWHRRHGWKNAECFSIKAKSPFGTGRLIATTRTITPSDMGEFPPEHEANARLLAAAPVLLDACKQLIADASANVEENNATVVDDYTVGNHAIEAICAAIATAEGKS